MSARAKKSIRAKVRRVETTSKSIRKAYVGVKFDNILQSYIAVYTQVKLHQGLNTSISEKMGAILSESVSE